MTDDELHDAILADATALALADAGSDDACAERLRAILPPVPSRYIPVRALIYWGALTGVRAKMQRAAADDDSPIQSLAISYMDMIRDSNSPGLDVQDPNIVGTGGMLDAFAAAGVFAATGAGSKAHLISVAPTSPAAVTGGDVSRVWGARYRPDGRVVPIDRGGD